MLLGLWGIGDLMIIFLAALLDVPTELYEAASLDGAGRLAAVPLRHAADDLAGASCSPRSPASSPRCSTSPRPRSPASVASGEATTGGGISSTFGYPEGSTFTYPLWLYTVGFRYNALGYANALAVVLFVVAFAVTLVLLRRSKAFTGGTR